MGQILDHPRNLASYVYYDKGQELRCGQNREPERAKTAWAHSPFGSVILVILTALFSLMVWQIQHRNAIEAKSVTNNCYHCTIVYQADK